jgi:hypothetical protein
MKRIVAILTLAGTACYSGGPLRRVVTDVHYESSECGGTYLVVTTCDQSIHECETHTTAPGDSK